MVERRLGAAMAVVSALLVACATPASAPLPPSATASSAIAPVRVPEVGSIEATVIAAMRREQVMGLAIAAIDDGRIAWTRAWGRRSADTTAPLTTSTVMYGASLTKAAFGRYAMLLVDDGRLSLDAPIASWWPGLLAPTGRFADLVSDPRLARLTARHVLTHASGFANFRWLEPDRRLRFHFEPGERYAYSGEGMELLQLAIEQGLGLDVGVEMERRVFAPLGMARTSMTWRDAFASDAADTWDIDGRPASHRRRARTSAAGSMDTTIDDQARFWAAAVRGDGLSPSAQAEWTRGVLPIRSAHQFPTLVALPDPQAAPRDLAAAEGVLAFGRGDEAGFYKAGHDDGTGNIAICVERGRRCVVLLGNDVRAERLYPELATLVLGPTAMPWSWEYGWYRGPLATSKSP